MDFRTIFEQVPEQFDKWRPRYCAELFTDLIAYANLDTNSKVLEVGPGTGQATEPILKTGCSYKAIELGESFSKIMMKKFNTYKNFSIVNADFETYPFRSEQFDLVSQKLDNLYSNPNECKSFQYKWSKTTDSMAFSIASYLSICLL